MEDLNLREAIKKSPYRTQERFAAASGIAEPTISKYCRNIRQPSENHKKIIDEILSANGKTKSDI